MKGEQYFDLHQNQMITIKSINMMKIERSRQVLKNKLKKNQMNACLRSLTNSTSPIELIQTISKVQNLIDQTNFRQMFPFPNSIEKFRQLLSIHKNQRQINIKMLELLFKCTKLNLQNHYYETAVYLIDILLHSELGIYMINNDKEVVQLILSELLEKYNTLSLNMIVSSLKMIQQLSLYSFKVKQSLNQNRFGEMLETIQQIENVEIRKIISNIFPEKRYLMPSSNNKMPFKELGGKILKSTRVIQRSAQYEKQNNNIRKRYNYKKQSQGFGEFNNLF